MKKYFQKFIKFIAYTAATIVILLALVVGLFRLLLPRLPEYQDEIKLRAGAAIGVDVDFSSMNARWRFSGPQLNFYGAEIKWPDSMAALIDAQEVSVGINLYSLLVDRALVIDQLIVQGAELSVAMDGDGAWVIQGQPLERLLQLRPPESDEVNDLIIIADQLLVTYEYASAAPPISIVVKHVRIDRDAEGFVAEASVDLPADMGGRAEIAANYSSPIDGIGEGHWQLFADSRDVHLDGWSKLLPDSAAAPLAGSGSLTSWIEFGDGQLLSATSNFNLSEFRYGTDDSAWPATLEGRVEFSRKDSGWLLAAEKLRLETGRGEWPESTLRAEIARTDSGELDIVDFQASFLNLDDLGFLSQWLPADYRDVYSRYQLAGIVRDLKFSASAVMTGAKKFQLLAELQDVAVALGEERPELRNFSGNLRATDTGGRLVVDSQNLGFNFPALFDHQIDFDHADGTLVWRYNSNGLLILSDRIRVKNSDFESLSSLQINLPRNDESPIIDLDSHWSLTDLSHAQTYLPSKVLSPRTYDWLTKALVAGSISQATTRLTGPIRKFPFDHDEGRFRVEATVENAELNYADSWPNVQNMNLELVVDKARLYSHHNSSTNTDNKVVDAKIEIADLREAVLTIDADVIGTLNSLRTFASNSPIANVFGGRIDMVKADGNGVVNLDLVYPIKNGDAHTFTVNVTTHDGIINVDGLKAPVTELSGRVVISRDDISSSNLTANFLGQPIALQLSLNPEAAYSVLLQVDGVVTADGLVTDLGLPLGKQLAGQTLYSARLNFPRRDAEVPAHFQIDIDSELEGMQILLPVPVAKDAATAEALRLHLVFPEDGQLALLGRLDDRADWLFDYRVRDSEMQFEKGSVVIGGAIAAAAEAEGLHVSGKATEARLQDWLNLDDGEEGGLGSQLQTVDLQLDNFYALGQHLVDHHITVDRSEQDWLVQVNGDLVSGSIFVPFDFKSGRSLVMDMEKLFLKGGDSQPTAQGDPTEYPPISIKAEQFVLGVRQLGRLEAEISRIPEGLVLDSVTTKDAAFGFVGSGRWVTDLMDESGQRSYLSGTLSGTDVDAAMKRLSFDSGIEGKKFEFVLDLSWSGGPRDDYLESLDGQVGINFGSGQLKEVEPGAGRVFGLMSIVSLPRRLSLDFSDVFQKGLGFDGIRGNFRIVNGATYTCDLSLKGPAVDIGIVGRAGLVTEDYNQAAIVSANVGNTLPVVGAVMAGPQVAAALLIFSQIFKKPLDEIGETYYKIGGSWDEPTIEPSDAARFAAVSDLAGCLSEPQ